MVCLISQTYLSSQVITLASITASNVASLFRVIPPVVKQLKMSGKKAVESLMLCQASLQFLKQIISYSCETDVILEVATLGKF